MTYKRQDDPEYLAHYAEYVKPLDPARGIAWGLVFGIIFDALVILIVFAAMAWGIPALLN